MRHRILRNGEEVAAITGGKRDFCPREKIFYGELHGGQRNRVLVKVNGERGRG